jgi:long-chain acyl-CoA synthetase
MERIAGPNVMMGYFKDEQLTNEVIVDGYFHTVI